jgi:hypothetical protein
MSNDLLFQKYVQQIADELLPQLSAPVLTLFKAGVLNGSELYNIAATVGITKKELAIIRQVNDCKKRYIGGLGGSSSTSRDSACAAKFLLAVAACDLQNSAMENLDENTMITLERARCDIDKAFWANFELDSFGVLYPELVFCGNGLIPVHGFSSGPGSCTGVKGDSLLQKYRNNWHVSTQRGKKLLHFLRRMSKPLHDLPNFQAEIVECVKATFVPKDHEISRLIAPQLNGDIFLQYPAEGFLSRMLQQWGINFETQQSVNREMARKGSLFDNLDIWDFSLRRRKVRYCTIDLVSASDIIGVNLVKFLLPPPLFNYLDTCRSSSMKLGQDMVSLPMMATMGNAYCFPLQTLVFASFVRSVYWRLGLPLVDSEGRPTWSVYGDDIIVDVAAYPYVIELLKALMMQPNVKKSFSTGHFRESCGEDYFDGYDIRPVFCEELRTVCDIYSLTNRIIDWGLRHSVDVSGVVSVLLSDISFRNVVPPDSGVHTGLRVPEASLSWLPFEWTKNIRVACSSNRTVSRDDRNVYTIFGAQELGTEVGTTSIRMRKDESSLFYFLRGGIKQVRKEKRVFEVTNKHVTSMVLTPLSVSIWDVAPLDGSFYGGKYMEHLNRNLDALLVKAFKRRYKAFAAD